MKKDSKLASLWRNTFTIHSFAQDDPIVVRKQNDAYKNSAMIILKGGDTSHTKNGNWNLETGVKKNSNISTALLIVDLGFANWTDKT